MRHQRKGNALSRKAAHRNAMLANMACSLIQHKRINTTVAKAKALKRYVEPLITRSKADSTHSRRMVFRHLQDKHAVTELFREVAPKVASRPGGYTRILRTGTRLGDAAEMCLIELVDFNETYTQSKEARPAKTRRKRRGGKKKKEYETAAAPLAQDTSDKQEPKEYSQTGAEESSEPETTGKPEGTEEPPEAEIPGKEDTEPMDEENKKGAETDESQEKKEE